MTPRTAWRVGHPTPYPLPPRTAGLLEDGGDALPVRITLVQDGVMTGWDDGALGFERDAVWFSGRACSFRVAASDLTFVVPHRSYVSRALEPAIPEIELRHPRRQVRVRLCVLSVPGRNGSHDIARIELELDRLGRGAVSKDASAYPPLTPRPGLLAPEPKPSRLPTSMAWVLGIVGLLVVNRYPTVSTACVGVVAGAVLWERRSDREPSILRRIAAEESQGQSSP